MVWKESRGMVSKYHTLVSIIVWFGVPSTTTPCHTHRHHHFGADPAFSPPHPSLWLCVCVCILCCYVGAPVHQCGCRRRNMVRLRSALEGGRLVKGGAVDRGGRWAVKTNTATFHRPLILQLVIQLIQIQRTQSLFIGKLTNRMSDISNPR